MAALIRLRHAPVLQRSVWHHFNKVNRSITTSKNSDAAAAAAAGASAKTSTDTSSKTEEIKKNWVSYGFHYKDQQEDTNVHHASFFFSISLCIVFGGFLWAYAPDIHMRDWASREAFLELRRRERENAPLIDPNAVNPKTMKLPPESELCDVEIVI